LRVDAIDLLYLHAPDPNVSLAESADALQNIVDRGWARWAGVSNVDLVQLELFHRHCPVVAVQTFFNLFQQQSVGELREFCQSRAIALVVYWVLMKGMLAGHMLRDHPLDLRDRRRNYPIYQGQAWQSAQDLLDRLRVAAAAKGCSVAQWVLAWTLTQPGVSVALVGAKHPDQIEDTAQTFNFPWEKEDFEEVDGWLAACSKGREW
jgi:aryl-alcohol dehydrogenase-like predicted oxidoreductase